MSVFSPDIKQNCFTVLHILKINKTYVELKFFKMLQNFITIYAVVTILVFLITYKYWKYIFGSLLKKEWYTLIFFSILWPLALIYFIIIAAVETFRSNNGS